jgi:PAS domain S-box-containing protein
MSMPATRPPDESLPSLEILDQLPDAVVYADPRGTIVLWNRAAEALFGFGRDEVVGRNLDVMIPERFRRAHWEGYERAVAAGRVAREGEVRLTRALHKDGRKLYATVTFGLVLGADGRVLGVVSTARAAPAPERPQAGPASGPDGQRAV